MNRRLIMTVLAAAVLGAGVATAQQPGRVGARRLGAQGEKLGAGAGLNQRVLAALDLTDAQKAQIKTILQDASQSAKPVREAAQKTRQDLTAAIMAGNTAQIQSLSATLGTTQGQLLAIRGGARTQIYQSLTPDQKTKLDTLQQAARVLATPRRGAGRLR
jgi:Spy/CpxP family protein refolding chaperone